MRAITSENIDLNILRYCIKKTLKKNEILILNWRVSPKFGNEIDKYTQIALLQLRLVKEAADIYEKV